MISDNLRAKINNACGEATKLAEQGKFCSAWFTTAQLIQFDEQPETLELAKFIYNAMGNDLRAKVRVGMDRQIADHWYLIRQSIEAENVPEALDTLRSALEHDPALLRGHNIPRSTGFEMLIGNQAVQLTRRGKLDAASEYLASSLELIPADEQNIYQEVKARIILRIKQLHSGLVTLQQYDEYIKHQLNVRFLLQGDGLKEACRIVCEVLIPEFVQFELHPGWHLEWFTQNLLKHARPSIVQKALDRAKEWHPSIDWNLAEKMVSQP